MNWENEVKTLLEKKAEVIKEDLPRTELIRDSVERREAIVSANGALATWTPPESTGRSPKDTVIVKRKASEANIDWDSPNNIPITEETFDMALQDGLSLLEKKETIYITNRIVGADSFFALPVKTITDWATSALFTDNMFRPVSEDLSKSCFYERPFTLIALPYEKLERNRYKGHLRQLPDGKTTDMIVAMDMDRHLGVIIGSAYGGSIKKLIFTVMNYILPMEKILPLHCSANEGEKKDSALLLGLSGTGKTSLSADPSRALLGDDEHGWSDKGIANFENGCYAKFININPEKETEIYNAVMHEDDYLKHGALVENAMIYPDGSFDFDDDRFTPNSRASYPLRYLSNIKPDSKAGHPKTILFLTADANGVIPPVSKLTPEQAMLWFLMGYTSKLAGTETGIVEPVSTFSRFFGEPFMPLNPDIYASMLGEKMKQHGSQVYLINTGWSGAPYGEGDRMDINLTREMVKAALNGKLADVEYEQDEFFKVWIPKSCPEVPENILNPKNSWNDKEAFKKRAEKLARDFKNHFDKAYGNKNIDPKVAEQCPGR